MFFSGRTSIHTFFKSKKYSFSGLPCVFLDTTLLSLFTSPRAVYRKHLFLYSVKCEAKELDDTGPYLRRRKLDFLLFSLQDVLATSLEQDLPWTFLSNCPQVLWTNKNRSVVHDLPSYCLLTSEGSRLHRSPAFDNDSSHRKRSIS